MTNALIQTDCNIECVGTLFCFSVMFNLHTSVMYGMRKNSRLIYSVCMSKYNKDISILINSFVLCLSFIEFQFDIGNIHYVSAIVYRQWVVANCL